MLVLIRQECNRLVVEDNMKNLFEALLKLNINVYLSFKYKSPVQEVRSSPRAKVNLQVFHQTTQEEPEDGQRQEERAQHQAPAGKVGRP